MRSAPTPPMHELFRLVEKIDTVIKDYLRQRFGVTADVFKSRTLEDIVARLRLNPNHFKEMQQPTVLPAETSTYGKVKNALLSSIKYMDKTYRYYTNTDGTYRLDTMSWLCWSMRNFEKHLKSAGSLTVDTDSKSLKVAITRDIKDFLEAIRRILDEAFADEKSSFKLSRERKTFHIYGLREDPSELGRLLRVHLQDEFDIKSLTGKLQVDIDRKVSRLNQTNIERAKEKQQYQQLEESNADLLRKLEVSHNSIQQLKSELDDSRERSSVIASELRIKKFQEDTFERRIDKLEKEKQSLEKKQSQLDKNSQSVQHLQSELDAMQDALNAVERERNEVMSERQKLLSQVQSEHERQEQLQQKITDAHGVNNLLAEQLEQVDGVVPEPIEEEYVEGDDDFDVEKLSLILRRPFMDDASLPPTIIPVKPYPVFGEEFEDGLTCAQTLVLAGEVKGLKYLLKQDPSLVNTVCSKVTSKNPNCEKTLLELVLFDSEVQLKTRKEMLVCILQYRPDLSSCHRKVLSDIMLRFNDEETNQELSQLFCEYVIATNTCSAEALQKMKETMSNIESIIDKLQERGADDALRKLSLPLTVCRALRYGYIDGSFSKSTLFLDGEKLPDSARYEVLYDKSQRDAADEKYKRKYGVPLLRASLLTMLSEFYLEYSEAKINKSVQVYRPDDDYIVPMTQEETKLQEAKSKQSKPDKAQKIKHVIPELDEASAALYSDLVIKLTAVIDKFGVILNAKGFNTYQRTEIALQIVEHHAEQVVDYQYQSSPGLEVPLSI